MEDNSGKLFLNNLLQSASESELKEKELDNKINTQESYLKLKLEEETSLKENIKDVNNEKELSRKSLDQMYLHLNLLKENFLNQQKSKTDLETIYKLTETKIIDSQHLTNFESTRFDNKLNDLKLEIYGRFNHRENC